jgi:hypothetical protein
LDVGVRVDVWMGVRVEGRVDGRTG